MAIYPMVRTSYLFNLFTLNFFAEFGFTVGDIGYNLPMTTVLDFDLSNLEQQLQLGEPEFSNTAIYSDPISTSLALDAVGSTSPSVAYRSNANRAVATSSFGARSTASAIQSAIADQGRTSTNSGALIPHSTSLIHVQAGDGTMGSSGTSRHGQTEKYFCPYRDCIRSQQGSGFKRKDKLDQHLRGPHKQNSVPRIRALPAASSSTRNLSVTDNATNDSYSRRSGNAGMKSLMLISWKKSLRMSGGCGKWRNTIIGSCRSNWMILSGVWRSMSDWRRCSLFGRSTA